MLLYPNGGMYYGQQSGFLKVGIGKMIDVSGGF